MNERLKRLTAASLVMVWLLVGFFAELTHRHAMPSTQPTVMVSADGQPSGQHSYQKVSTFCFVCQASLFAVDVPLVFSSCFLINAETYCAHLPEFDPAPLASLLTFSHRGPPAFLA